MSADDGLIRELPLLRRYARHNEPEDVRFAAYVKNQLNLSNTELDALVVGLTDEVWAQIECTSCGHCCKHLQIVVDDKDIQRMSNKLDLTLKQFAQQYVSVAEDRTKHFTASPCPFLDGNNCCTAYEARPQACRDFPYLHAGNFRRRVLLMVDNGGLCPIVFNVWQRLKERLGTPKPSKSGRRR